MTKTCIQEMHLNKIRQPLSQSKVYKKVFQVHGPKKQTGVTTLISNKIDFQPKFVKNDKEGHFIFIKGKIHQDKFSVMNIYTHITKIQNTH